MNKATIEQLRRTLQGLKQADYATLAVKNSAVLVIEAALAALSSVESEPTISRIALTEFVDKYCSGDSALIACAEAAFFSFNLSAGTSPSSAHSDVSQDGGNGDASPRWKSGDEYAPYHPSASHVSPEYRDGWNACYAASQPYVEGVKPIWDALTEIGQEAAAKGAFDQPEAPALTDEQIDVRILAALRDAKSPEMFWKYLSYESGPHSIDKVKPDATNFVRALLSAPAQAAVEPKPDHSLADLRNILQAKGDRLIAAKASPDAQAIREAAQALVGKIQRVNADPAYINVFFTAQLHGGKYDGPNYAEELAHLEDVLKSQAPQPAQESDCDKCSGINGHHDERCANSQTSQVKDAPASLTSDVGEVRLATQHPIEQSKKVLRLVDDYIDGVQTQRTRATLRAGLMNLFEAALTQPAAEADERELPPLPCAELCMPLHGKSSVHLYDADQMRAYAKAALAQSPARKRVPKLVLALPDYDKRRIVIASDDTEDDERLVCVAIQDDLARQEQWQPIHTAPKDGTNVIVCIAGFERSVGEAYWWEGPHGAGGWQTWDGENHRRTVYTTTPTHWMPLPTAVAQLQQRETK